MTISSGRITTTISGGVADVRLNRPNKKNALDYQMFEALVTTAQDIAADNSVRCVVLSGEGDSFCAGLDFASFLTETDKAQPGPPQNNISRLTEMTESGLTHFGQQACYGWTSLRVPVIGAISGFALGGGVQLALACDIRILAPEAQLSVLEIKWGLIPDMTGTQTLVDLVGLDVAKELTFSGRFVDADESLRIGLCTSVSEDPLKSALEMAAEIAAKSPHAIQAAKRLLSQAHKRSTVEGLAAERDEVHQILGSPNQIEAVAAQFEGRTANYRDVS